MRPGGVVALRGIPLADERALAAGRRRALGSRAGAFAVVAALAVVLAASTSTAPPLAVASRPSTTTVVLLDVSGSIDLPDSTTIVHVLRSVGNGGGHAGLVLVSDATEEVVPPTAPASELLAYVPLFSGQHMLDNPWSISFSAGTQIGKGLAAAHSAIGRAHVPHGRVILVSDVDDSLQDLPAERRELLDYARDPSVTLHLVTVPDPSPAGVELYRRALGRHAVAIAKPPPARAASTPGRGFPWLPAGLAIAAAAAVAAFELVSGPLAWREAV